MTEAHEWKKEELIHGDKRKAMTIIVYMLVGPILVAREPR